MEAAEGQDRHHRAGLDKRKSPSLELGGRGEGVRESDGGREEAGHDSGLGECYDSEHAKFIQREHPGFLVCHASPGSWRSEVPVCDYSCISS